MRGAGRPAVLRAGLCSRRCRAAAGLRWSAELAAAARLVLSCVHMRMCVRGRVRGRGCVHQWPQSLASDPWSHTSRWALGVGEQRQGCSRAAGGPGLRMQMQSEPSMARRSLLGAAAGLVLLGGQEGAMAKGGAPAAKPIFIEEGLSYVVKKSADGIAASSLAPPACVPAFPRPLLGKAGDDMGMGAGPLAKLALAAGPGDFVVINYIAYLRDGTIFDNTIKRGKPVAFQVAMSQQCRSKVPMSPHRLTPAHRAPRCLASVRTGDLAD